MGYIALNLPPILLATAASLVLGAAYAFASPAGAGARRGWGLLAVALPSQLWLACILAGALILAPPQAGAWTMALGSALVIWIGFVLPALATTGAFRGGRVGAIAGDAAYWLVAMLTQAVVLHLVGLHRP